MAITHVWWTNDEQVWKDALERYWQYVSKDNIELEKKFELLDANAVKMMSLEEFYRFLNDEYFVWKYTAKNRLATTRNQLQRYKNENRMLELKSIKDYLFAFELHDIKRGLEIAVGIRGLGIAGASGLLALLFPKYFATVDQFVVKALNSVERIPEKELLAQMNPEGLKLSDGVHLIKIMKNKAESLNRINGTDFWTPRKIDKVLWTFGR